MEIVISFVLGAVVAAAIIIWFINRLGQAIEKELAKDLQEAVLRKTENTVVAEVEVVDNQYFCYNKQDGQFICQGNSIAEISERFLQRFPSKGLTLVTDDNELLEKLKKENQTVKTQNEIGSMQ